MRRENMKYYLYNSLANNGIRPELKSGAELVDAVGLAHVRAGGTVGMLVNRIAFVIDAHGLVTEEVPDAVALFEVGAHFAALRDAAGDLADGGLEVFFFFIDRVAVKDNIVKTVTLCEHDAVFILDLPASGRNGT